MAIPMPNPLTVSYSALAGLILAVLVVMIWPNDCTTDTQSRNAEVGCELAD